MSKTTSVKKNYIYNIINQALSLSLSLFTAPYLSRVLEADGIGRIGFTSSIVSYFCLFAVLGTASYGQREISYLQDNRIGRTDFFWNNEILSLVTSCFCLIAYLIWVVLFGVKFRSLYMILALQLVGNAIDISWLFSGMENFVLIVKFSIFFKVANFVSIFLFIHGKDDTNRYALMLQMFSLINYAAYWLFLSRYVDKPSLKKLRPLSCLSGALSLFIPTIASSIYTMLDKIIIGIFTETTFENGYYELSQKIPAFALSIITSLAAVVMPRLGFYSEKGDLRQVCFYMKKSFNFVWLLGFPMCMGILTVSSNIVPWFFGDGYEKVATLMKVNSFLILAIGINRTAGIQYMLPLKKQNKLTVSIAIGAIFNVMMNIVLIPRLFSIGAALASVFAEFIIGFIQLFMLRKELPIKEILFSARNYAIASGFMAICLTLIGGRMRASVFNTAVLVIAGVLIYLLILLILRDDFLFNYVLYYKTREKK